MPLGKEVSGVGLSLSHIVSPLGLDLWPARAMDTLFPFITLGRAQKVYFFTPRLLSAQPSSAPDLPTQFLASSFPLLGLSKLPGMFWTLSAPFQKG